MAPPRPNSGHLRRTSTGWISRRLVFARPVVVLAPVTSMPLRHLGCSISMAFVGMIRSSHLEYIPSQIAMLEPHANCKTSLGPGDKRRSGAQYVGVWARGICTLNKSESRNQRSLLASFLPGFHMHLLFQSYSSTPPLPSIHLVTCSFRFILTS